MSGRGLVTRKEVDASGLTAVLARGSADVLRYAERRIGTEDAADALAEVMLTAWRRVDSMPRESEQARMWLFGIARNVVANATRSEHRRWRLAERLRGALASTRVHGHPADHGLEVRDAIARLSGEQAELVRLVHWEGFQRRRCRRNPRYSRFDSSHPVSKGASGPQRSIVASA